MADSNILAGFGGGGAGGGTKIITTGVKRPLPLYVNWGQGTTEDPYPFPDKDGTITLADPDEINFLDISLFGRIQDSDGSNQVVSYSVGSATIGHGEGSKSSSQFHCSAKDSWWYGFSGSQDAIDDGFIHVGMIRDDSGESSPRITYRLHYTIATGVFSLSAINAESGGRVVVGVGFYVTGF